MYTNTLSVTATTGGIGVSSLALTGSSIRPMLMTSAVCVVLGLACIAAIRKTKSFAQPVPVASSNFDWLNHHENHHDNHHDNVDAQPTDPTIL